MSDRKYLTFEEFNAAMRYQKPEREPEHKPSYDPVMMFFVILFLIVASTGRARKA